MSPPTSGPIASASADTPAQIPIAVPRCRGGKVAAMIESVAGFISAAPAPCNDARRDQHVARAGEPARRATRAVKTAMPITKIEPAAVRVGELAADQHQRREREGVAGDDPLQLREADAEVALDRRQRDVHDRVVQHDHEQAERDRREREPLACLLCEDPLPSAAAPPGSPDPLAAH